MTRVVVTKAHGLGNDFLIVVDETAPRGGVGGSWAGGARPDPPALFDEATARRLCDRHRGVGADGFIRVAQTVEGWRMDLRNADGGVAEISGNGLRCVARLLHDRGLVGAQFTLDTAAGPRQVSVAADQVTASMGVPVDMPRPRGDAAAGLDLVALSLGNPQVVVFVADPREAPVSTLGPVLEHDRAYPERTNVAFATAVSRHRVEGRIWERGVGETEASGTGACACAVAARLRDRVDPEVTVALPGGDIQIRWDGPGDAVIMSGPAAVLFDVEVDLDRLG